MCEQCGCVEWCDVEFVVVCGEVGFGYVVFECGWCVECFQLVVCVNQFVGVGLGDQCVVFDDVVFDQWQYVV